MTKDDVLAMLADGKSHRKQFSVSNGIQKGKAKPTFSVPFDNGLLKRFQSTTGKTLKWNQDYEQYYCFLNNEVEITQAETWASQQGPLVFIRNLLTTTTALDLNMVDNQSGQHTELGAWEYAAKQSQDQNAINKLVEASIAAIALVSDLAQAHLICAIPAMAKKSFDLPRALAAGISKSIAKRDLTPCFTLTKKELSAKACSINEKWDAWANAELSYKGDRLDGMSIILVDDKYQSGLTMHFIASRVRTHSQNMTVAARAHADRNRSAQRS